MRRVRTIQHETAESRPWRTLLWIAVAGLVFGALGIGQILEETLRASRNALHWHKASGDIVIVKIDENSLKAMGRWPWPRRQYAALVDQLGDAGAKRIFFDLQFTERSSPVDDKIFADALARSGRSTIAIGDRVTLFRSKNVDVPGHPVFANAAELGSIGVTYNWQNAVWQLPYATRHSGKEVPSFSALLSNRQGAPGELFPVDYSIDPASIPALSASSVIDGAFDPAIVKGKDVVIGTTAAVLGDTYFLPGTGKMGGVYVLTIGAETLKYGKPLNLGWLPAFLASIAFAAWLLFGRMERGKMVALGAGAAVALFAPAIFESQLVFIDIAPALLVLAAVGGVEMRRGFQKKGLVDPVSGLPNLTALRRQKGARDRALIVARVINYAEVVAALPQNGERQLVDHIVARLSVGARDRAYFQGDGGIFAWFDDPAKPFGHHLEALHALFRTPVRVDDMPIDLSVSFGVEIGNGRSLANRLGSALVAAEDAAHDGLKWKYHDPDTLQNASWKLSILSQLDDAVDRGEVWVAYQPKVDLKTRRIVGAEALARWTHPQKGPIAAAEFIAAAEQHDRIGKLTAFVLDEAIAAASALRRATREFDMSVNLSGRLLSDTGLVGRIALLLERHGVDPEHLTLELTETAALAGSGKALDMLAQLRELGVNISIDDYGTGLSTLDYLKKIPAGEIKIDQSFVRGMVENRSERLMVGSTIALAHSLGRRVVAEGVETREALEILAEMECDIVQGFITGRPMSFDSLRRRLASERRSKVA